VQRLPPAACVFQVEIGATSFILGHGKAHDLCPRCFESACAAKNVRMTSGAAARFEMHEIFHAVSHTPGVSRHGEGLERTPGEAYCRRYGRQSTRAIHLKAVFNNAKNGVGAGIMRVKKSLFGTLVEVLGREPAEKIIAEFGGARIWIPVRSTPEARLEQLIGSEATAKLCACFGGDYLQVPNTIANDSVHRRIAELHRQGCKIDEIAVAVGRSRRTIFRLLGRKITELRRPAGFAYHPAGSNGVRRAGRPRYSENHPGNAFQ
jgi:hypothetical protein